MLYFNYILPTENLRDLVFRQLTRRHPELNYCCEWLDTNGFGIYLAVAAWNGGGMYHVPPSKRHYRDRPRWDASDMRLAAYTHGRGWRRRLLDTMKTGRSYTDYIRSLCRQVAPRGWETVEV
jgi:hypothetical protein